MLYVGDIYCLSVVLIQALAAYQTESSLPGPIDA